MLPTGTVELSIDFFVRLREAPIFRTLSSTLSSLSAFYGCSYGKSTRVWLAFRLNTAPFDSLIGLIKNDCCSTTSSLRCWFTVARFSLSNDEICKFTRDCFSSTEWMCTGELRPEASADVDVVNYAVLSGRPADVDTIVDLERRLSALVLWFLTHCWCFC